MTSNSKELNGFGYGRRMDFFPERSFDSPHQKMMNNYGEKHKRKRDKSLRIIVSAKEEKLKENSGQTHLSSKDFLRKRKRHQKKVVRRPLELSSILFPDLTNWPSEEEETPCNLYEDLEMCLTRLGNLTVASSSFEPDNTNHSVNYFRRFGENELTATYLDQTYQELYGKHLNFLQEFIDDVIQNEEREKLTTHVMIHVPMNETNETIEKF